MTTTAARRFATRTSRWDSTILDGKGAIQFATVSTFTNESGTVTCNDAASGDHLFAAGPGTIYVYVKTLSPSLHGWDSADDFPKYAVMPDRGSPELDAVTAAFTTLWASRAYEEDFYLPVTAAQADGNSATLNAVITRSGAGVRVIGGAAGVARDAFAAFTVADTGYAYAGALGINVNDSLAFFVNPALKYSRFAGGTGEIDLGTSDIEEDAKVVLHEMGHFASKEAGILNPTGGEHGFVANQRLSSRAKSGNEEHDGRRRAARL